VVKLPLVLSAIVLTVTLFAIGCENQRQKSSYSGQLAAMFRTDGTIEITRQTSAESDATASADAAAPTTQSVGEHGATSALPPVNVQSPAQIAAEQASALYWIGAGFALVSVLSFSLPMIRSPPLGVGAGAVAGVCFVLPTTMQKSYAPVIVVGGLVAVAGAAAWHVYARVMSRRGSQIAAQKLAEAERAAQSGQFSAAVDHMRSATVAMSTTKPAFASEIGRVK
jgi:hypothetical protein